MSEQLDRAIKELVECDETQGGVTRALRLIKEELDSHERLLRSLAGVQMDPPDLLK